MLPPRSGRSLRRLGRTSFPDGTEKDNALDEEDKQQSYHQCDPYLRDTHRANKLLRRRSNPTQLSSKTMVCRSFAMPSLREAVRGSRDRLHKPRTRRLAQATGRKADCKMRKQLIAVALTVFGAIPLVVLYQRPFHEEGDQQYIRKLKLEERTS